LPTPLTNVGYQGKSGSYSGLMAYGPNLASMFKRAASYVHRILSGVNPGELPIERPSKFELVINLKTASALGLNLPHSLLSRADELVD
jgi:putative tryptophan/tyrosine transport system substrate-binding protein